MIFKCSTLGPWAGCFQDPKRHPQANMASSGCSYSPLVTPVCLTAGFLPKMLVLGKPKWLRWPWCAIWSSGWPSLAPGLGLVIVPTLLLSSLVSISLNCLYRGKGRVFIDFLLINRGNSQNIQQPDWHIHHRIRRDTGSSSRGVFWRPLLCSPSTF